MRLTLLYGIALALVAGCTDGDPDHGGFGAAVSRADDEGEQLREPDPDDYQLDERDLEDLDCPPGPVGEIRVAFDCGEIEVISCKDLSNVVVEYEDGERLRYEGLTGHAARFGDAGGPPIVRTWIKAGGNLSGAGPGYGTEFVAPEDSCDGAPDAGVPTPEAGPVPDVI